MLPPLHAKRWGVRSPLTQHGEGRGAMRKRLLVLLMAIAAKYDIDILGPLPDH